ncbi:MAG: hypothetical protein CSA22_07045 [Deltaproteobacteria bacterium]|nr:MAG: hypothetical protein CSA22_07045 [Deltaproteobacteria bacterium]
MGMQTLRVNLAFSLLTYLTLAMGLIGLVAVMAFQRIAVGQVAQHGRFLTTAADAVMMQKHADTVSLPALSPLRELMDRTGAVALVVEDADRNASFSLGRAGGMADELKQAARAALGNQTESCAFLQPVWTVTGRRYTAIRVAAPGVNGTLGISVLLSPADTYRRVDAFLHLLCVYGGINLILLTCVGLFRFSNLVIHPVQRLVREADAFRDDGVFFGYADAGINDFKKLSRSLNGMMERIRLDRDRLSETVRSLETANQDLKAAQAEIVRAEKLATVGRLASGVAHEIGNPLGIVTGYLEMLAAELPVSEESHDMVTRAAAEVTRIDTIIRQLLDFSRPSPRTDGMCHVHDLIADIAGMQPLQPMMEGLSIETCLNAADDRVRADPGQLRQVLMNLVINAADALHSVDADGTRRWIRLETDRPESGGPFQIRVLDNGPGVSAAHAGDVFDPFFTTKPPGHGTGLGLWVVYTLITDMGGTIALETPPEDASTCFVITVPVYKESATY